MHIAETTCEEWIKQLGWDRGEELSGRSIFYEKALEVLDRQWWIVKGQTHLSSVGEDLVPNETL